MNDSEKKLQIPLSEGEQEIEEEHLAEVTGGTQPEAPKPWNFPFDAPKEPPAAHEIFRVSVSNSQGQMVGHMPMKASDLGPNGAKKMGQKLDEWNYNALFDLPQRYEHMGTIPYHK